MTNAWASRDQYCPPIFESAVCQVRYSNLNFSSCGRWKYFFDLQLLISKYEWMPGDRALKESIPLSRSCRGGWNLTDWKADSRRRTRCARRPRSTVLIRKCSTPTCTKSRRCCTSKLLCSKMLSSTATGQSFRLPLAFWSSYVPLSFSNFLFLRKIKLLCKRDW